MLLLFVLILIVGLKSADGFLVNNTFQIPNPGKGFTNVVINPAINPRNTSRDHIFLQYDMKQNKQSTMLKFERFKKKCKTFLFYLPELFLFVLGFFVGFFHIKGYHSIVRGIVNIRCGYPIA